MEKMDKYEKTVKKPRTWPLIRVYESFGTSCIFWYKNFLEKLTY
jgi:hypothetical protein